MLLGRYFPVRPHTIFRLLLPQGSVIPIAVSEVFAVLQVI